eukprot:TRINITY_DN15218_c0_g1_i1.p1 TRINITY_DN15218_c0_g1~~TRINITY_DN15218_c0_g1_i1.p1  ORF type:complete len:643 (+),score=139.29 TRINITY_DN15218_c0_g1_i1:86-2014(+)
MLMSPPQLDDPVSPVKNPHLEAFKQCVDASKNKRKVDLEERRRAREMLKGSEAGLSQEQMHEAKQKMVEQSNAYLRQSRSNVKMDDFDILKVIGVGAFGMVRLCRKKETGEVFALKQMKKSEMVSKNKLHHVRAEKEVLAKAGEDWVTRLHYTFQDDEYLYMVLDYLPGGDLMTHLMRKDTFTEDETRFYIAELVEALDYIHTQLQYVHRDIKPDNIIFDAKGHLRLLDFGLCKHHPQTAQAETPAPARGVPGQRPVGHRRVTSRSHLPREKMMSVVGSPDYIAPEIYRQEPYGKEVDWWSVGIIMFEMLFGGPPFSDEEHNMWVTAQRVKQWRHHFFVPTDAGISPEAIDLLRKLICEPQDRIAGAQIRVHPFFKGMDFSRLRELEAPIKPEVTSEVDTQNFDEFAEDDGKYRLIAARHHKVGDQTLYAFHDYNYRRELEGNKPNAMAVVEAMAPEVASEVASKMREAENWKTLASTDAALSSSRGPLHQDLHMPKSPLAGMSRLSVVTESVNEERSPSSRSRAASGASTIVVTTTSSQSSTPSGSGYSTGSKVLAVPTGAAHAPQPPAAITKMSAPGVMQPTSLASASSSPGMAAVQQQRQQAAPQACPQQLMQRPAAATAQRPVVAKAVPAHGGYVRQM